MRKIVFSKSELLDAFNERPARRSDTSLPEGSVEDVHVYQKFGGGVKVLIDVRDSGEERIKRFSLDPAVISDILLNYCNARGIPISKQAEKYLEVIGDNIALSQKIRAQEAFEELEEGSTPIDS
jgi:hypothetical protein